MLGELLAWYAGSWRPALLGLAAWCLYEFLLIPTVCRVMTEQGYPCREPVRGRPFACRPDHQALKNEGILRLLGVRPRLRRPVRGARPLSAPVQDTSPPAPPVRDASGRGEGVVVHSRAVRARLAQADQALLILAGAGTVVTIAGMIYGIRG
ncbi:hypothetical protein [Actinomadura harenae]|uniref:hypothetical protein n=1 Tax=Actinomadura harenae TaxID=2483351 RepID=UPI0018F353D8|nr:hypothetical protein [Actinomadura harenae]